MMRTPAIIRHHSPTSCSLPSLPYFPQLTLDIEIGESPIRFSSLLAFLSQPPLQLGAAMGPGFE